MAANLRATAAQESADWALLELALQESAGLRALFPRNGFVAGSRLGILMHALEYCRRHDVGMLEQKVLVRTLTLEARRLSESVSGSPLAHLGIAGFYDFVGEQEKAKVAWLDVAKNGSPLATSMAVAFLYREGMDSDAEQLISYRKAGMDDYSPEVQIAEAYMLVDDPERRTEAIQLCRQAAANCPTWWIRQMATKAYLLLGEGEFAKNECRKWVRDAKSDDNSHPWIVLDRQSIEFLAGESKLDNYVRDDTSMTGELCRHYTLGCLAISKGEREKAIEHLRECRHNNSFVSPEAAWANAFLRRLETDSQWPRGHRLKTEGPTQM